MLNSTKLTFKKRQITIILESLSFLEIMKKISRPLLCDWCAQKRISLRASIFFVRVYFVRLCQKIYSQFYFLSRKNWNNYVLSEKNLYLKNFKTFVENYIKEKICHEISNRKKTMLQTQFHSLIQRLVLKSILIINFYFEMLEMNNMELSWTTVYFLQYIKWKCKKCNLWLVLRISNFRHEFILQQFIYICGTYYMNFEPY